MADWQPPELATAWQPPELTKAKPAAQPQQTGAAGLVSRVREALTAGGRGAMQGAGDILYGGAQIGARMAQAPQIGQTEPEMPGQVPAIDKASQQREAGYQQSIAGHPVASAAGRLLGNMAETLPLGAAGGAVARGMGLAGRLATAGAIGAGAGLAQATEGKNFGKEKLEQAVYGTGGGLAGGAVGEAAGSLLGKAIGSNNPQTVDTAITRSFRRAVRPGKPTPNTASGRTTQDDRILSAVDSIVAARPDLQLTNEAGQTVTGQLPRSLSQFSEAIEQTKKAIYKQYDDMARAAGQKGAEVDLAPIVSDLRKMASDHSIIDHHPEVAATAENYAKRLEAVGSYSAETAQSSLQNLNQTLKAFWRNPTPETVGSNGVYARVSDGLRKGLDAAIEKFQGPGYQALRNRYGAIKSVEDDVSRAVTRDSNRLPGGLSGNLTNMAASEELWRGLLTANPAALLRAGTIKAGQATVRYLNSPNRAIQRLFEQRAATMGPPSVLSGMLRPPTPGMAGALAGAAPMARDYLKDRSGDQVELPSGLTVSRP